MLNAFMEVELVTLRIAQKFVITICGKQGSWTSYPSTIISFPSFYSYIVKIDYKIIDAISMVTMNKMLSFSIGNCLKLQNKNKPTSLIPNADIIIMIIIPMTEGILFSNSFFQPLLI